MVAWLSAKANIFNPQGIDCFDVKRHSRICPPFGKDRVQTEMIGCLMHARLYLAVEFALCTLTKTNCGPDSAYI